MNCYGLVLICLLCNELETIRVRKLKSDSRESVRTKKGKSRQMNPLSRNRIQW